VQRRGAARHHRDLGAGARGRRAERTDTDAAPILGASCSISSHHSEPEASLLQGFWWARSRRRAKCHDVLLSDFSSVLPLNGSLGEGHESGPPSRQTRQAPSGVAAHPRIALPQKNEVTGAILSGPSSQSVTTPSSAPDTIRDPSGAIAKAFIRLTWLLVEPASAHSCAAYFKLPARDRGDRIFRVWRNHKGRRKRTIAPTNSIARRASPPPSRGVWLRSPETSR
jgi:hypothetical protein